MDVSWVTLDRLGCAVRDHVDTVLKAFSKQNEMRFAVKIGILALSGGLTHAKALSLSQLIVKGDYMNSNILGEW